MNSLGLLIALTIPASVGLAMLGEPIVAAMFQRGAFDAEATGAVAWSLAFFAVGLVGHSALEVLGRAFYALHDTWTPALAAGAAVVLNAVLGLWLPGLFARAGAPPLGGLALSTALAALFETIMLFVVARRRLGSVDVRGIVSTTARVVVASVGMAAALRGFLSAGPADPYLQSLIGTFIGVVVYVALAWILRIDQLRLAARMVLNRAG